MSTLVRETADTRGVVVWSTEREATEYAPGELRAIAWGVEVNVVVPTPSGGLVVVSAKGHEDDHYGPAATHPYAGTVEQARAIVEEAARTASDGDSFKDALARGLDARVEQEWLSQLVALVLESPIGSPGEVATHEGKGMERHQSHHVAVNLAAFVAEMRRRGFVVQPDGSIREEWREMAAGRWLDTSTLYYSGEASGDDLVRVESGHVLNISDSGDGFNVYVDNGRIATVLDREEAKAYAIERARRA